MTWRGDDDLARAAEALASRLPPELGVLARVAYNYRWSWAPGGRELFRSIDPYRWTVRRENPVRLLLEAPASSVRRAAADESLIERASALHDLIQSDLARPFASGSAERPAVFLCAEYGVHNSLPIYSGGLGVLAGDILKEASDRALAMVGVGLLYRQGIFRQRIDTAGWQHEYWVETDPDRLPAALVTGDDGVPVTITIPLFGHDVAVQIWRVDVGRVPLYLLDTQLGENSRVDRWITSRLYVGDRKVRLAQYGLLGIGGIRALRALGIDPTVIHLNEGHASFAPLELAREEVARGTPLPDALESAREGTVFTTHTPVPAGNETYRAEELWEVLGDLPEQLRADAKEVLALGRSRPEDSDEPLGLTVLGIRMSRSANAVSRRHGEVARLMWQHLFPDRSVDDVPIRHVTNAVHLPTWMAPAMRSLLDLYLGEGWVERAADPATWEPVADIPDEELWSVRSELRADLVAYLRDHATGDRLARGEDLAYAEAAGETFDPGAITIGFARRVAAYKRLYLLVRQPIRALGLLQGEPPVQMALAGKAHPVDEEAKHILQSVFSLKRELVGRSVAYLEDYDMSMAHHLTSGCDVWLNLPRPPLEASGTSGMKSALNGGLNLSVLDGWWEEAFDGTNGWAIPENDATDPGSQDERDAEELYRVLEQEVNPLFYERDGGIPRGWVARIKRSLMTIGPRYCAARMLEGYRTQVYRLG